MKVVITGGLGFLGLRLARRLLELGELTVGEGGPAAIDTVILADREIPSGRPDWLDSRVELVACDVTDRDLLSRLVDRDDVSVFHLAAIVSAEAERDPELAWRVNVEGGRNVLEAVRSRAGCPRVVVTSTYAVFGGELPDVCGDDTRLTPQSTYGMTKALLELLVADYSRRGTVDGRVARLPTVIVRPGVANAAASSVASAIFREPLAGRPYQVPVTEDTRMAFTDARTAVEGLIALHEVSAAQLGDDRSVSFPSRAASIREMVECLKRVGAGRQLGAIGWNPDPVVQAIVSSWPHRVDAARAVAAGVPVPDELDRMVREAAEAFFSEPA
jgi:nucleoside-diphosphate-sugar epimerase